MRDIDLFTKAWGLRRSGKSYSELNKILGISRSTLSSWFSKKRWSKSLSEKLNRKYRKRNAKRIILMNKARHLEKLSRYEGYRLEADGEYQRLKVDSLFTAGVSIYWGEGEKTDNGRVSVINTDPELMQVMVNFYRKILKIPDYKLRAALFIYKDINQDRALRYWSRKIRIPISQFIKTQVLPSKSNHTKRKILNGICNVYFSSVESSVKMKEWIKLLAFDMRV